MAFLKPSPDRVLVEQISDPPVSDSHSIGDFISEELIRGKVLAVGQKARVVSHYLNVQKTIGIPNSGARAMPVYVQVGDTVLIPKSGDFQVEIVGIKYHFVKIDDILGILKSNPPK